MTGLAKFVQGSVEIAGANVTSHPRCGDSDRERTRERVREAYARGFLSKDEAETRVEAIGQCTLQQHLEMIVQDIPNISRFSGASLPAKNENRAKAAVKWWQARQPWTALGAILGAVMLGIAPGVTAAVFSPHTWTAPVVALTAPPAVIIFLASMVSLFAKYD